MPKHEHLQDKKGNFVFVTLFETYLAKFVLEHPLFYRAVYEKILQGLDAFFKNADKNKLIQEFFRTQQIPLDRYFYTIFSRLDQEYPGNTSFEEVQTNFQLSCADYLIKLIADELLTPIAFFERSHSAANSPESPLQRAGFFIQPTDARRSPYNPIRCSQLFHEDNRGVIEIDHTAASPNSMEAESTLAIGIVCEKFRPVEFSPYFTHPIYPASYHYMPKEDSYVAIWLSQRGCPIISGSSGSTEQLFSKIFPLVKLSNDEKRLVIFAQACNMVANGHHSFFEAMIVADYFGFSVSEQPTLREFYLQCVPESIREHPEFITFITSEIIQSLPMNIQMSEFSSPSLTNVFD